MIWAVVASAVLASCFSSPQEPDLPFGLPWHRITDDPGTQTAPDISGDFVVWQDDRHGQWDVFLYDLGSERERRITSDSADQTAPAVSEVGVVWEDLRDGNAEIYVFEIATGTERRLTIDPEPQIEPDISGNRIVWRDFRDGRWDLFLYDLRTRSVARLTDNAAVEEDPSLQGDRIVWREGPTILSLSLSSGVVDAVGDGDAHSPPRVSGDRIVWTTVAATALHRDIVLYETASKSTRVLIPLETDQHSPDLSDEMVIWIDSGFRATDIVFLDLAPDSSGIVNRPTVSVKGAPRIDGRRVVAEVLTGIGSSEPVNRDIVLWRVP